MASPPEVTCKNLTGKFVINKTLSDDSDALFVLQGLSWLTRTAIGIAKVVITVKEYQDNDATYHVDITSVAAGVSTVQENRVLDWTDRTLKYRVFGTVKGKSRLFKRGEFEMVGEGLETENKFLQGETLKDDSTPSHFLEEESLHSWAHNQDEGYGWTAEQVWNFEEIEGKRYYTRRIVGRKEGQPTQKVRLVYDYQGPPDTVVAGNEDDGLAYGEE